MSHQRTRQSRLAKCERCDAVSSVQVLGKKIMQVNGKGCACADSELSLLEPSEAFGRQ